MRRYNNTGLNKIIFDENEKETLITAHQIISAIAEELYEEEGEDTDDVFKLNEARDGLRMLLEYCRIL